MLPLSILNSVKERGSNGALRSHLFAKGRTRRGGSRLSFAVGMPSFTSVPWVITSSCWPRSATEAMLHEASE